MHQFDRSPSAFTAGSSQPSGPKRGIVMRTPSVPLKGLEYVHRVDFPREESQAGLTTVSPTDYEQSFPELQDKHPPLTNTRVVLITSWKTM